MPFSNINVGGVVINEVLAGRRPDRPVANSLFYPDELWDVTEECWKHYPLERPSAKQLACILVNIASQYRHVYENTAEPQPLPSSAGPNGDEPGPIITTPTELRNLLLSSDSPWVGLRRLDSHASAVAMELLQAVRKP
jgi:hypothetical protein